MKAIVKNNREYGVQVMEVDTPGLMEDEVLVKVLAASICGSDIHMYEGMNAYEWVKTPVTLGHEFAGKVVKVSNEKHKHLLDKTVIINPYVPCGHCNNCQRGKHKSL